MKFTWIFALMILAYATTAFPADGIIVSTHSTTAHAPSGGGWRGDIARFTVKNNKVVKLDTIHSCRDGDSYHLIPGDPDDKGVYKTGTKDFISVMNIDGSNRRDIVEFSGDATKDIFDRAGYDRLIDWPKGEWIYYQYPRTGKIYKVSADNPAAPKFVVDYGGDRGLRRWNLNADGTRAVVNQGNASMFPEIDQRWDKNAGGCNHAISPSGRWIARFGGNYSAVEKRGTAYPKELMMAGHSSFNTEEWVWETNEANVYNNWFINDYVNIRHLWRTLEIGHPLRQDSVPKGAEIILFACNSDKWELHTFGYGSSAGAIWRMGTNQIVYNWADREWIVTSTNPQNPKKYMDNEHVYCATSGDMWVQPPKDEYRGTHYEDIEGNWLPIGSPSNCPYPDYMRCDGGLTHEECALKFDTVCIRTKSVFTKIITRGAVYGDNLDRNNIKIAKNAKVELTVTDQWGDPIWGMGYHEPWDKSTTANTGIYDPDYYKQTPPKVEWSVESNCGSISNDGVFTAGTESGPCKVSANVTVDKVSNAGIVTMLIGDVKVAAKFFSPPVSVKAGAPRMAGKRIIMLPANSRGMATLIDASGKAVYASPVCGSQLHIPRLSSGAYVLHVKNRETVVSAKIFIP